MNKILLLSVLLLVSLFALNANAAIVINSVTMNQASYDPSATVMGTISVNNTAGSSVTVTFTSTPLTKSSDTITAPVISSKILNANENNSLQTFTFTVPAKLFGTYTGTITASDGSSTDTKPYSLVVNSKAVLTLSPSDKLTLTSQTDKSRTKIFTIKNDGSVTLNPTASITGNFTDNDDDIITFTLTSLSAIAPGAQSDVTLTASVPNDMDLTKKGSPYTGTITVTDTTAGTKTLSLEVNIEPEICEDGRVSNKLAINSASDGNIKVDVKEPDSGDDFAPGSDIKVSLNVENDKDNDIDVVVEAILYNIDQNSEIERVESDSISIDEDEDQDVDLTLKVPTSDSDLDEGDDFVLFIKASEDGDEDENCNYDTVDLDFERSTNDVIINKVTVSPQVVSCSETVNLAVDVQNVGTKDQDSVQIKLRESTLGMDLSSEVFSLKKFDKSGDTALKTFTFKVPSNAKEGDYFVDAKVFFQSRLNTLGLNKLTIIGCQAVSSADVLTLSQTSFTALQGKVFTVPLTLKNSGSQTATYTVDIRVDNGWADVSAEQRVSVSAGEQTTVYAYLTPKPGLTAGTYTAAIDVKQDDQLLKTSQITANVGLSNEITGGSTYQPSVTLGSVWRNLAQSTAFWITAVVIIFALVIYVLSALLRPR